MRRYWWLITGDFHLDEKKPKNRKEGYVQEQEDKVKYILQLAKDQGCSAILQPGDFCNTSKLSDGFKTKWINIFRHYNIPIYTVPGQHDMRYHSSDIKNTPLGVFQAAGVVNIMGEHPLSIAGVVNIMGEHPLSIGDHYIYGAGWEQEIPNIDPPGFPEIGVHILLLHKLVSEGALWPGHEGYITPKWLFNHTDFDLIVCGDNHKGFVSHETEERLLINCGSLMRSSIDQQDHKPFVYIYDSNSKGFSQHFIPVKPFEEVMNIEEAQKEKARNKELEDFVEGLSDTNIEGLDFKKNLIDYLKSHKDKIGKGVVDIINELIG